MTTYIIEVFFLSILAAASGIFYRNCLKGSNMIFNFLYVILQRWAERKIEITFSSSIEDKKRINNIPKVTMLWYKLLKFIAYPLGYCTYCTVPWISIILTCSWFYFTPTSPLHFIVGVLGVITISHVFICIGYRWLIYNHPDFDECNSKTTRL
jgi:hypothetical protein